MYSDTKSRQRRIFYAISVGHEREYHNMVSYFNDTSFLYLVIILSGFALNSVHGLGNNWLDSLLQQITETLGTYQIALFINSNKTISTPLQNTIFQQIIQEVPSVVIDLAKSPIPSDYKPLALPGFRNPRHVTLYLVIHREVSNSNSSTNLNAFFDFFVKLQPHYTQPKCLVILLSDKISNTYIRSVFKYAWAKKFLDFSILDVNADHHATINTIPLLHYYNPFYGIFHREYFNSNFLIFPDKLYDGNGNSLKVPIFHFSPYLEVKMNNDSIIEKITGSYYELMPIIAKRINFYLEYIFEVENGTLSSILDDTNLQNSHLNMMPIPFPRSLQSSLTESSYLALDSGFIYEDVVVLVPVIEIGNINISLKIFQFIFIVPFITGCFSRLLHFLKIKCEKLMTFNVLQVLLSVSLHNPPKKLVGRIIYFCIIILSIQYARDFYSDLIDNLVNDEVTFNSFDDIIDYPLQPYVDRLLMERAFVDEDQFLGYVKKKSIPVEDVGECADLLQVNKTMACIAMRLRARVFTKRYLNKNRSPIMMIAKPVILSERWAYLFEKSSPYIDKFYDLLQRLFEFGVFKHIVNANYRKKSLEVEEDKEEEDDTQSDLFLQLQSILTFGYGVSVGVFCAELVFNKLKHYYIKVRKRRFKKIRNKNVSK